MSTKEKRKNMSHPTNDQLLDTFADHNYSCQQYNFDNEVDIPIITDCICDEVSEIQKKEDHQEMLMEVERGN